MSGGVFLKRGDDLVEMVEQPYQLEDHLQELIERHPNLLAGDQVNPDAPRRWLLLSREAGLASEEDGAARWSVDHLLLDQDAIPTIVEVKRSSDSRIRREVIGQMLDYAANAVTYWNIDVLRERYEETVRGRGREPEDEIAALVNDVESDYGEYWERAKTNLRAGRIRLVSSRTQYRPSFSGWSSFSTSACRQPRSWRSRYVSTWAAASRCWFLA